MSLRSDCHSRNTLYLTQCGMRPQCHIIIKDVACGRLALDLLYYRYRPFWEVFFFPRLCRLYLTLALCHLCFSSALLSPLSISPTPPVRGYERRRLRHPSPLQPTAKPKGWSPFISNTPFVSISRDELSQPCCSWSVLAYSSSSRNLGGAKYSALTATRCTIRAT